VEISGHLMGAKLLQVNSNPASTGILNQLSKEAVMPRKESAKVLGGLTNHGKVISLLNYKPIAGELKGNPAILIGIETKGYVEKYSFCFSSGQGLVGTQFRIRDKIRC
jgi:hypothetical protein